MVSKKRKLKLPKIKLFRTKLPKLKLYQQIIIYFILVVFIPLVGASFIIHSTNQKALKKELIKFTEHTSENIFRELQNQMVWNKEQTYLLGHVLMDDYAQAKELAPIARRVFNLSESYEAVGLYDKNGNVIDRAYQQFSRISPERRLPEQLVPNSFVKKEQFQLVYSNTGNPEEITYYLRATVPTFQEPVAYYVLQKRFDYLQHLIHSNNKDIYNGFFIINEDGRVIAGPNHAVENQQNISNEDLVFFKTLKPGVTKEFSTPVPTLASGLNDEEVEAEKALPLQKVFVKMPELGWGIIIESPYEVRQKYIKRAQQQTLLLLIGCFILITAFMVFYVLALNRNFRQLIKGIKAMAEGQHSRQIRLITNWFTPHEIVYLTGEFNRMGRKHGEAWANSEALTDELRSANKKLSKLDEMKSNLIDTVSHELRTPLTSIKGYSSRLIRYEGTIDSDTRIKNLKTIKRQADRLNRLVDDLLVIPELESERLRVFLDKVELSELIERSVQFIQQKEHRDIAVCLSEDFAKDFDSKNQELNVLADHDRLEQILLNLLDNAVKYSLPETDLKVSISLESTDLGLPSKAIEQFAKVTVENQCEPIAQDELDSLFEKFKRLDESMTRTTRGSGLGLFITKGLVEAMGGEISLEAVEARFSITFTIPLYQDERLPLQESLVSD